MLIGLKEHGCLTASEVIQISVHTTPLHNILEVKIRLAVAYEVNFFTDQFYIILALAAAGAQK